MKITSIIFFISINLFSSTTCQLINIEKNQVQLTQVAKNSRLSITQNDQFRMYLTIEDNETLKVSIKEIKKQRFILNKKNLIKNVEVLKLKTKLRGFQVFCRS